MRLIRADPEDPVDDTRWPATVPAVRQLLDAGLEVPAGPAGRISCLLRPDTRHGLYSYPEDDPGASRERFHELSHG